MTDNKNEFRLRVWGEYACFTRPEMKVERVSYDVMTPSAARNVLQAILWKPAIEWQINRIDVVKPVRWFNIKRNEVKSRAPGNLTQAHLSGASEVALYVDEDRQQRAGLLLKDVEYVIHATFGMTKRAGNGDNEAKFREQFKRRATWGQCCWQPYLGCREFTGFFELLDDEDVIETISDSRPLGWMLFDLDFSAKTPAPMFFEATLLQGSVPVPNPSSEAIKR